MKKILIAAILFLGSTAAQAQLTVNAGAVSDYRYRGISQTQNAMAFQGGIDYTAKSGFYVGNWNSSVSSEVYTNGAGIESDIYAGMKQQIFKGITLDFGSYNYFFPKASTAGRSFDTNEVYVAVSVGPLTAKYNHSLSDYFGTVNSKGSAYMQLNLDTPLLAKTTLNAHVGRTEVANSTLLDYTDYRVGITYDLKGYNIGGHYYTNSGYATGFLAANTVNGQRLYKDTFVVSVNKSF